MSVHPLIYRAGSGGSCNISTYFLITTVGGKVGRIKTRMGIESKPLNMQLL